MKAIVVRQPYAALIMAGIKTIETRPAPPNGPMRPQGVRGLPGLAIEPGERIAICAAAAKPKAGEMVGKWECNEYADGQWRLVTALLSELKPRWLLGLHFGAAVGTVVVSGAAVVDSIERPTAIITVPFITIHGLAGLSMMNCVEGCGDACESDISDQLPLGEYEPGRWGWLLADPTPCDPIPVKGKQGVFLLPDDVAEQVTR